MRVKTNDLRNKSRQELLQQLSDLRTELASLRVAQATGGGAASKLAKISTVRQSIARVLTVFNQTQKAKLREEFGSQKYVPRELRSKKTRALRRALTPAERKRRTVKQQKVAQNSIGRYQKFYVKAEA